MGVLLCWGRPIEALDGAVAVNRPSARNQPCFIADFYNRSTSVNMLQLFRLVLLVPFCLSLALREALSPKMFKTQSLV